MDDKQEKFKSYTTIEKPLHKETTKKNKEECKYITENVQQGSNLESIGQEENGKFKV